MANGKPLRTAIESGKLHSMVFWGPPGTGKTTLAKLVAKQSGADFVSLSAVLSGVKDILMRLKQQMIDSVQVLGIRYYLLM